MTNQKELIKLLCLFAMLVIFLFLAVTEIVETNVETGMLEHEIILPLGFIK